jgi:hypothetical protein
MAKDKLTQYDATASNNTDVGGISVAEGMLPSGVNNAIREQMSHLADFAAGTSGVDVLKLQDDTDTNSIKLQAPSSVTADTTFTMPDGDGSADQVLKTDGSGQLGWVAQTAVAPNPSLIINGAMRIHQRTGTISATGYLVDRFSCTEQTSATFTGSQSTTAPAGFTNSSLITIGTGASATSTQYAIIVQNIEGNNIASLGFGTSDAENVTLSFWVRSSVTGTFCASIKNSAANRAYIKEYTISVADTWEYKTLTFPGDTTGTWLTDNGIGIRLAFDLGSGSGTPTGAGDSWITTNATRTSSQTDFVSNSGATFYLTGVKLESGDTATPFDHRSYGEELALCQRYYEVTGILLVTNLNTMGFPAPTYMVEKRATPNSFSLTIGAGSGGSVAAQSPSTKAGFYQSNVNTVHTNCEVRVDAEL